MLKGLDTSAVKYISQLVPAAVTAAASTTAVDLSDFTFATLLGTAGSTADGAIAVNVQRSATSNGTFQPIGCSINLNVANKTKVRSFTMNSSCVWYKLHYTQTGNGSPITALYLIGQGSRKAPINQHDDTTSYSVISNA